MIDQDQAFAIIADYIENGTKHPHYNHMVDKAEWCRNMFTGIGQEEDVKQIRGTETDAQKEFRVAVSYPETPEVLEGIQTKCERIYGVDGISETIRHTNASSKDEILKTAAKFSQLGGITDYLKDRQLYYEFIDPNAWLLVERRDRKDATGNIEEINTYPFEVLSHQAVNYEMGPNEPDWLLVRHVRKLKGDKLETLYLYTAGLAVKARQIGKGEFAEDNERSVTFDRKSFAFSNYLTGTTSFPGMKFGAYNDNSIDDMSVKAPIYDSARFVLKRIIKNASLAAVQLMTHVYQKMIAYDRPCDYENEEGTRGCGVKGEVDAGCPSCGGTGSTYHKSEQDLTRIALPYDAGDDARQIFKLTDLIHYVDVPLEPTKLILERLDLDKANIPYFVFNSERKSNTVTTATEETINWESASNRVRPMGSHNEKLHRLCYNSTAQHLGFEVGFEYDYRYPKKMGLETEAEIMDRYAKANEMGLPPELVEGIGMELLAKRHGNDKVLVANAAALAEFKPFPTDNAAAMAIAFRSQEDPDLILYHNWRAVSRIVRYEHPEFFTLDYSDKVAVLDTIIAGLRERIILLNETTEPLTLDLATA